MKIEYGKHVGNRVPDKTTAIVIHCASTLTKKEIAEECARHYYITLPPATNTLPTHWPAKFRVWVDDKLVGDCIAQIRVSNPTYVVEWEGRGER